MSKCSVPNAVMLQDRIYAKLDERGNLVIFKRRNLSDELYDTLVVLNTVGAQRLLDIFGVSIDEEIWT
jgi:hypothetical protein